MSVAGDIIDDLKFDRTDKVRVLTGLAGAFAASIFVVIGVFGSPDYSVDNYVQAGEGTLQKVSSDFSGGVQ